MLDAKVAALADLDPKLSNGEAGCQLANRATGRDPGEPRGRVGSERIGAYTGLDLPKLLGAQGNQGPEVPPLTTGLPHTPLSALQELMLAIVVQGLADDDLDYVISPTFIHHLLYVGLDPDVALRVKIKYLRNEIKPHSIKNLICC